MAFKMKGNPFKQKISPLKQSPVTTVGLSMAGGFGTNTGGGSDYKDYSGYDTKESCKDAGGCWGGYSGKTRESSYFGGEEGWIPDSWQGGKHKKIKTGTCYSCGSVL